MKFWLSVMFGVSVLFDLGASEMSRQQYLALVEKYPGTFLPRGEAHHGEIEIIVDPIRMEAIEQRTGRTVGVIASDPYWLWINDACLFPSGREGVYGRIIWVHSLDNIQGVAVLPVMPDGKIALNCNFRHASRTWEIECPRGGAEKGESSEQAARREALEETGLEIGQCYKLGEMAADTGVLGTIVPIYAAEVIGQQESRPEDGEAIDQIVTLTTEEILAAFRQGYLTCTIHGKEQRVPFRDPFLAYAILLYKQ